MKYNAFLRCLTGAGMLLTAAVGFPAAAQEPAGSLRLPGHLPAALALARPLAATDAAAPVHFSLALPARHADELDALIAQVSDPASPEYGRYLTTQQFAAQFGPTEADYEAVAAYARSQGFTVTQTYPSRLLMDVTAPAAVVESAFSLHLNQYRAADGATFRAPDADPAVPLSVAARLIGIIGLDTAAVRHAHLRMLDAAAPRQTGSGPGNGLAPSDIKTAYGLNGVSVNGAGQTLAVFELDGYNVSDVTAYENYFKTASVPLQNVLVDGATGKPGSGQAEVTLDIELQAALAPGAAKILVYEGPNSDQGVLDTYARIASDNLAKSVSTSWGLPEDESSAATLLTESLIFKQMAVQGQSLFAAAGDSGAYDDGSHLSVDDPASQPFVTGVGGTSLTTNGKGGAWKSETTWNGGSASKGAGGGGISSVWGLPYYQAGVVSVASKGSATQRNVPDVALNADPNTGYAIYVGGGWHIYGGTSCAAPLWSGFAALANQARLVKNVGYLGFANPLLYQLGQSKQYGADFHDIADKSTNLYWPAVAGYDLATGWGSFSGAPLLTDLSGLTVAAPAAPTGLTAASNGASGQIGLVWTGSQAAAGYDVYRSTTSGKGYAKIGFAGSAVYTDSGLVNGTTYYYVVTAANSAGESGYSNQASASPVAPKLAITGGPNVSVGTTTATVTWTTNLASTSAIAFGTSAKNLNNTGSSSSLVTSHGFSISGLPRKTTFYYQVSSSASGTAVSSSVLSFTTN